MNAFVDTCRISTSLTDNFIVNSKYGDICDIYILAKSSIQIVLNFIIGFNISGDVASKFREVAGLN